jgi:sugar-specific transcriptional regulator TrmB
MALKKDLVDFGLTDNEAGVYLATLELGETTIIRIAKKASIKRTTTYLAVESLREKGLINTIKKNKKTFLYGEDPRILEKKAEEKKENIKNIIPQLLSITNLIDRKPVIKYFEGKEGMKTVFKDVLEYPNSKARVWYSEDYVGTIGREFFDDYYIPERIKKKIWTLAIHPDDPATRETNKNNPKELRNSKYIQNKNFELPVEILIYGKRKVSIISLYEEISLIIESEGIHNSLKSIFDAQWDSLPD